MHGMGSAGIKPGRTFSRATRPAGAIGLQPKIVASLRPKLGEPKPEAPPDKPDSQEAEVASILPIVGLFSANFLVLRQISYFFDWWCRLLGGRR
jgi:hypothetical protein